MNTSATKSIDSETQSLPRYGQRLIPTLIDEIAELNPERPFAVLPRAANLEAGFEDITFGRFSKAINKCSWWIRENLESSSPNGTIAYVGSPDLMYHIVTLAALKTGHTAFLPSHRESHEAYRYLFEESECKVALLQESLSPALRHILDGTNLQVFNIPKMDFFLSCETTPSYRYHASFDEARYTPFVALHSSGSTGLPHIITVHHGTLAGMDANQLIPLLTGRPTIGSELMGKRVLMAFPLYHMVSFTLLLGLSTFYQAVVVLPPPEKPLTASLVHSIHLSGSIDVSVLPPSIMVDMYHDQGFLRGLANLQRLCYTGGPLPREVGDKISRLTHLTTIFGSTEVAFPAQETCDKEDWEYVHYSPFNGSIFRPLHEDGHFEQVIIRRRELDLFQSVFSTYPDKEEFHTKDLYCRHPVKQNLWRFGGRLDDVIIFSSAEKFNPVVFESTLSSHPAIKTAIVGGHGKSRTCLLVEPITVPASQADHSKLLQDIWAAVAEANNSIPGHARVMKDSIVLTDTKRGVKRAGKGTIIRDLTLQLYSNEIENLYKSPEFPKAFPSELATVKDHGYFQSGTLRDDLVSIVSSCVWLSGDLKCDADLFDLGLDSVQTVALCRQINANLVQLVPELKLMTPQIIYANPTIDKLDSVLRRLVDTSLPRMRQEQMQSLFSEWSLNFQDAKRPATQVVNDSRSVLLTGSTGSLGSYILDSLLSCPNIVKIYCLNRGGNSASRQAASFDTKGLPPRFDAVEFIQSDLAKTSLGFEADTYQGLLQEVTDVIHNSWDVNSNRPLEAFVIPHISGIRNLIDFCNKSTHGAHLYFISSKSTVAGFEHQLKDEIMSEIVPSDWAAAQNMGYAQAKLVAERLIDDAAQKSNLNSSICRVGQIAGPVSDEGCWNKREWFPSLVRSSIELGKIPNSLASSDIIDWIPVELVARIIVDILRSTRMKPALNHGHMSPSRAPTLNSNSVTPEPFIEPSTFSKATYHTNDPDKQGVRPQSQREQKAFSGVDVTKQGSASSGPTNTEQTDMTHEAMVYNIVNPKTVLWSELLVSFRKYCTIQLEPISLSEWLEILQQEASKGEDEAARLPAIMVLDYFKDCLIPAVSHRALGISNALCRSKTMAELVPVSDL